MSKKATVEMEDIMHQAQVFASAWALVGGRWDDGRMIPESQAAKSELQQMIEQAIETQWQNARALAAKQCTQIIAIEASQYDNPVWAHEIINDINERFGVE